MGQPTAGCCTEFATSRSLFPVGPQVVRCRHPPEGFPVPKQLRDFAFVLFTVLGIPVLIALPFLLSGFIGRK